MIEVHGKVTSIKFLVLVWIDQSKMSWFIKPESKIKYGYRKKAIVPRNDEDPSGEDQTVGASTTAQINSAIDYCVVLHIQYKVPNDGSVWPGFPSVDATVVKNCRKAGHRVGPFARYGKLKCWGNDYGGQNGKHVHVVLFTPSSEEG